MNYSRILRDGAARDEALKRRNGSVRDALGMGPARKADAPADKSARPARQGDDGEIRSASEPAGPADR
jgi:hypothetical protein